MRNPSSKSSGNSEESQSAAIFTLHILIILTAWWKFANRFRSTSFSYWVQSVTNDPERFSVSTTTIPPMNPRKPARDGGENPTLWMKILRTRWKHKNIAATVTFARLCLMLLTAASKLLNLFLLLDSLSRAMVVTKQNTKLTQLVDYWEYRL